MYVKTNKLQLLIVATLLSLASANPQSILDQTAKLKGPERVISTSQLLLGSPYKLFPLGEGDSAEFANKPLYSFSAFDCLTFVETTLALAFSKDPQQFLATLLDIRYHDQKHNFASRNHFTSTEWNYYNQEKGYISDITTSIQNKDHKPIYKTVKTLINKPAWLEFIAAGPAVIAKYTKSTDNYAAIKNTLLTYAKEARSQTATTAYIPVDKIIAPSGKLMAHIYSQLPKIFIVEIVRKNWGLASKIGTELDISHLGFGIKTEQGLILRHASETKGAIVDVPLTEYLLSQAKQQSFAGINIMAINLMPDKIHQVSKIFLRQ